ncbi:hypothetical protein GF378_02345 [Candidatus Pacearchaeota archaeon]|nr:hypothetical protein [Candidatus Pacearchaeota archaeon]
MAKAKPKTKKSKKKTRKSKPNYVYEFTNKRKLTKSEFLKWFQKKFLYIMRKFNMVGKNEVVGYKKANDFRTVVLEDLLKMFAEKSPVEIKNCKYSNMNKKKVDKFAVSDTSDVITNSVIKIIIKKKVMGLEDLKPVNQKKKIIRPLYLFLDKEVKLYAKLKKLKYKKLRKAKKDKITGFIEDLEKKHPELKHSVVKTYLDLF